MLVASKETSLSRRVCALTCSAMISRRRRSRMRGPPATISPASCRVQFVRRMQRANREFDVLLGDQNADLYLRCRDHLDVDALVEQGLEHGLRDAGMGAHANADDRYLGDIAVGCYVAIADRRPRLLDDSQRRREIATRNREGQIGLAAVLRNVLNNHVN